MHTVVHRGSGQRGRAADVEELALVAHCLLASTARGDVRLNDLGPGAGKLRSLRRGICLLTRRSSCLLALRDHSRGFSLTDSGTLRWRRHSALLYGPLGDLGGSARCQRLPDPSIVSSRKLAALCLKTMQDFFEQLDLLLGARIRIAARAGLGPGTSPRGELLSAQQIAVLVSQRAGALQSLGQLRCTRACQGVTHAVFEQHEFCRVEQRSGMKAVVGHVGSMSIFWNTETRFSSKTESGSLFSVQSLLGASQRLFGHRIMSGLRCCCVRRDSLFQRAKRGRSVPPIAPTRRRQTGRTSRSATVRRRPISAAQSPRAA